MFLNFIIYYLLFSQTASQPYMHSWKWYCGTFLLIFGEMFNLAAYGFAPATLVAVLGTFSIAGTFYDFFFRQIIWNLAGRMRSYKFF